MEKKKQSTKIRRQYVAVVKAPAPIRYVAIYSDDGETISGLTFGERVKSAAKLPEALQKACVQVKEYFEGKRTDFDLPLSAAGTSFQKEVWNALQQVPFGELQTYQALAKKVGRPKAARAVGNAIGRNPLPLIVPCHRVVAASGLGGFSGGLPVKKYLLSKEGSLPTRGT